MSTSIGVVSELAAVECICRLLFAVVVRCRCFALLLLCFAWSSGSFLGRV
jgi:hypothetical protein